MRRTEKPFSSLEPEAFDLHPLDAYRQGFVPFGHTHAISPVKTYSPSSITCGPRQSIKPYLWPASLHVTRITTVITSRCGRTRLALSKLEGFTPPKRGVPAASTMALSELKRACRTVDIFDRNSAGLATHSYLKASAGRILEADQDGYKVAMNETRIVNTAIQAPSIRRGANGT